VRLLVHALLDSLTVLFRAGLAHLIEEVILIVHVVRSRECSLCSDHVLLLVDVREELLLLQFPHLLQRLDIVMMSLLGFASDLHRVRKGRITLDLAVIVDVEGSLGAEEAGEASLVGIRNLLSFKCLANHVLDASGCVLVVSRVGRSCSSITITTLRQSVVSTDRSVLDTVISPGLVRVGSRLLKHIVACQVLHIVQTVQIFIRAESAACLWPGRSPLLVDSPDI